MSLTDKLKEYLRVLIIAGALWAAGSLFGFGYNFKTVPERPQRIEESVDRELYNQYTSRLKQYEEEKNKKDSYMAIFLIAYVLSITPITTGLRYLQERKKQKSP